MLNVKTLKRKLRDFGFYVGVHQGKNFHFSFLTSRGGLWVYIDGLKDLRTKKHELVPNPKFYKLLRKNRKEDLDKHFRTRIIQAKLFRDQAAKDGIHRNLPQENQTNIHYVKYANDFLLDL
jgi:hypothetical protein